MSSSKEQFEAARQRVEDLLRELTPFIGPIRDAYGNIDETVEHDHVDALLSEWVVIGSWIDQATGEPFIVRLCSANLPGHHRSGLLFEALYRMEDE